VLVAAQVTSSRKLSPLRKQRRIEVKTTRLTALLEHFGRNALRVSRDFANHRALARAIPKQAGAKDDKMNRSSFDGTALSLEKEHDILHVLPDGDDDFQTNESDLR
jgi:hypothetical protein